METTAKLSTANLSTYLSDHLAGSSAGVEMAKNLAEKNPGNAFFEGLVADIKKDQDALERVMDQVGASESSVKTAGAMGGQKIMSVMSGIGASDHAEELGTLRESELLSMGILGKLRLWQALDSLSDADERLAGYNFGDLIQRARTQLESIEGEQARLARKAFLH